MWKSLILNEVSLGIIEYPIDADYIMQKKKSILRGLREVEGRIPKKIAIFSGSTIGELESVLRIFLQDMGIEPEFYTGGYGRFYEDLVFDDGSVKSFAPDIIYIHTSVRNLNFPSISCDEKQADEFARLEFEKYRSAMEAAMSFGCPVIQNNFELPPYRPAGNAEARFAGGMVRHVGRMNTLLAEYSENRQIYINDINYISSFHGLNNWHDETAWYAYKYPFAVRLIPYLSHSISIIISSIFGKSKKAVILDLDNTLWGGVIGDDGAEGIEIGNESPLGMAHLALCDYSLRLKEQGVMLAVCSKNENDIALSGFSRDEMPLKVEDFVTFKANWEPKSENIKSILAEMNINADAAIFIDDNPAERHIVAGEIYGIVTPELKEPDSYLRVVDENNFFELTSLTGDDKKRTEFIRDNLKRSSAQGSFTDYGEYLKSLEMSARMVAVGGGNIERVTQLVNKTNQFNMTTRRFTEQEVEEISRDENYITICASLSDRFGDNGIVSVIFAKIEEEVCVIELFTMSCRVFKRELEYAMIDRLVKIIENSEVKTIKGIFIPTAKNKPCADFYENAGFTKLASIDDATEYELLADGYVPKAQHIELKGV